MAEQEQNRSEPATPFKLDDAKKKGQVAKSLDFNSFAIMCALLLGLLAFGRTTVSRVADLESVLFGVSGSVDLTHISVATTWFANLMTAFLGIILPFAAIGVAFAVLANLLQTGPIFTFEPIKPKFERINPAAGFKRVFNKRMLFEGVKTLVKLCLFSAILWFFLKGALPGLPAVAVGEVGVQTEWLASRGTALLFRLGLAMLVIGLLDLAYVRWQYRQQMMMSRRELREETKRREGDPLIRAKLRELQRENLKRAKSMGRVPDSDVLITNPQHLAIALRYVRGEMSAPHIVAKGMEAWAAEMRAVARRNGIPVIERRSLARELYRRGQLERPIPSHTFVDVARVYVEAEAEKRARQRAEVRQ